MQPPGHGGSGGEPERDRSDLFSVHDPRESRIPQLMTVPETPEERRRRTIVRIVTAVVAIVILVTAILVYLAVAHSAAVKDAALAASADARPANLEEALSLLEGDDSAADLALRARLHASAALELGDAAHVQVARDLLARIEGDGAASSLEARVAQTYVALAEGRGAEAAQHVTGMAFAGPFAAEGAHASALSGLAVGDLAHALETSQVAVERQPAAPRYAAARAVVLARSGEPDQALALLEGLPEEARSSPAVLLSRARIRVAALRDLDVARADAQAVVEAEAASPIEKSWARVVLGRLAALAKDGPAARQYVQGALEPRPPGDEAFLLDAMDALVTVAAAGRAAELAEHLPAEISTDRARRAQLVGAIALEQGRLDTARSSLETALDDARTALLRARLAHRQGDHDRARTLYRAAAGSEHHAVDALSRLGAMELELARPAESLAAAEEALGKAPTDPDAVAVAVRAHVALEDPQRGMALVTRALGDHPEAPRLLEAKAAVQMALGQWSEALATLRAAVERETESADLWAMLGDAARMEGQAEESGQAYAKAVELAPQHPAALVGLLELAVDAKDLEQAKAALEKVDGANVESPAVDRARARYFVASGAGQRGIEAVRRAITRRARDGELWRNLAWLQYQAEIYDSAARSFARGINLAEEGQTDLEARLGLAISQIAMRATAPAEKTIAAVAEEVQATPDLPAHLRALLLAAQAKLHLSDGRLGPARNVAQQAIELDDDLWVAHEVVADVLDERNGDPTSHLTAAAGGVPPSVAAMARLAMRAEGLNDQVCEWANAYRGAAPRGRYERRITQIALDCRRR